MFNVFKKKKQQQEQHTDTQGVEVLPQKLPENQSPLELKVKFLSLSAEVKIIKRLEKKLARANSKKYSERRNEQMNNIRRHRYWVVKEEARATHLARAFLNGLEYHQVERSSYSEPNWDRMEDMVLKYGKGDERVILQSFERWFQEASAYFVKNELVHDGLPKPKRIRPSNRKPDVVVVVEDNNSPVAQPAVSPGPAAYPA